MGNISSLASHELAPTEASKHRTDTETYKAATLEFLDKAWGDEQWKPPATIPRRDGRGTPFPPNHPWTVGELDVLKNITISALSRDILPLSSLYQPGGAIFEAAAESQQPRWCIKICAEARGVVRESAEPRLTKKQVFDMVMAGTMDGKTQVRVPVPSGEMKVGCPEHRGCLCRQPSLAHKQPVSDFGISKSRDSRRDSVPEPWDLAALWDWRDRRREALAQGMDIRHLP